MDIVGHLETYLGEISQGWKDAGSEIGVQIVCFENSPFDAVDSFTTLGLSDHQLRISNEKEVRQELIFAVHRVGAPDMIISCLMFVCDLVLSNHRALLRGQIIRLPNNAFEKLGFQALYCAIPVFMDDSFSIFDGSNPPTVMVWTIPIFGSEANFIDLNGWDEFENVLVGSKPDLFSLKRGAVV